MKAPRQSDIHHRRLEIELTPMIDVVFLLLVFFVWSARFTPIENLIFSDVLATSGSASAAAVDPPPVEDFDRVVIRLIADPGGVVWVVNEQPRESLAAVRDLLGVLATLQPTAPVVVDPDPAAPLGEVIAAYDAARGAGFSKVQFAAKAPE
jgi:biopolymer transport protein ExbD